MIINKENKYHEAWGVSTLTGNDKELENVYYRATQIKPDEVDEAWRALESTRIKMDKIIKMYAEVTSVGVDIDLIHLNTCNDHIVIHPDGEIYGKYHGYVFNAPKNWDDEHKKLLEEIREKDDQFSRNPKINEIIGGEMRCTERPRSCGCPECVAERERNHAEM
ncbi:MAG: hypothetical protein WC251_03820 [Candidatus Izemoplasmatales bacterium]|jgi:hypothetical protein|nr:hypothetical protein [Dehalococcoidia bacterium]